MPDNLQGVPRKAGLKTDVAYRERATSQQTEMHFWHLMASGHPWHGHLSWFCLWGGQDGSTWLGFEGILASSSMSRSVITCLWPFYAMLPTYKKCLSHSVMETDQSSNSFEPRGPKKCCGKEKVRRKATTFFSFLHLTVWTSGPLFLREGDFQQLYHIINVSIKWDNACMAFLVSVSRLAILIRRVGLNVKMMKTLQNHHAQDILWR